MKKLLFFCLLFSISVITGFGQIYVSTGSNVNVRKGPGKNFSVQFQLQKGDKVYFTGKKQNGFMKVTNISSSSRTWQGWVSERYLRLEQRGQSNNANTVSNFCPDNNHPHAIDLGLPDGVKWACCNVGARSPEEYGGYYAWGETYEKTMYNWRNYCYSKGREGDCSNIGNYWGPLGYDISNTIYDVARVMCGNGFQMPSYDDIKTLFKNCKTSWITLNGIQGKKIVGSNGNAIFLPAAGYKWSTDSQDNYKAVGESGHYWTSTQDWYNYRAQSLIFRMQECYFLNRERYDGCTVRPIKY